MAATSAELFTSTKIGKKARQALQAAVATLSLDIVVEHMRAFVADLHGPPTLSLPPMTRHMRKSVLDLAHAFHLKSKSECNGPARLPSPPRRRLAACGSTRERSCILDQPNLLTDNSGGRKGRARRESRSARWDSEVGGVTASKIDGSNAGFQILAAMGWEGGSRIGTVGGSGLDVPLWAVIKSLARSRTGSDIQPRKVHVGEVQ